MEAKTVEQPFYLVKGIMIEFEDLERITNDEYHYILEQIREIVDHRSGAIMVKVAVMEINKGK